MKKNNDWFIYIFYFLIALFLYPPIGLKYYSPILSNIVNTLQIVFIAFTFMKLIMNNFKLTKVFSIILLYYIVFIFSSIIVNDVSLNEIPVKTILITLSLVLIFSSNTKDKNYKIISSFLLYFEIITILQIICQFLYPNGMVELHGYSQNWILGFKNYPARVLLPGLCFSLLWSYNKNKEHFKNKIISKRTIFDFLIISYVIIKSGSGTGIAGLLFYTIFLIVSLKRDLPKFVTVKKVMYSTILVFILIFFANIQNIFSIFIVNILQKDLTFTGRIDVWSLAFDSIKNNLFFGVGLRNDYSSILRDVYSYAHAHQYFLHIMFSGGIIAFSLIIYLYGTVDSCLKKCQDKYIYSIFTITICSFLIMGIDEALMHADMFFALLALAYEMSLPKT